MSQARSWLWISAIPEATWPAMSRHRLMQPDRALARSHASANETKRHSRQSPNWTHPPTSDHSEEIQELWDNHVPKTVEGGRRSAEVKRTPTLIYIYIYVYIYIYMYMYVYKHWLRNWLHTIFLNSSQDKSFSKERHANRKCNRLHNPCNQ